MNIIQFCILTFNSQNVILWIGYLNIEYLVILYLQQYLRVGLIAPEICKTA